MREQGIVYEQTAYQASLIQRTARPVYRTRMSAGSVHNIEQADIDEDRDEARAASTIADTALCAKPARNTIASKATGTANVATRRVGLAPSRVERTCSHQNKSRGKTMRRQ